MKSHTIMARPFIEKADQIQKIFFQSDDEKQIEHSVQFNPYLNEKISFIRNTCPNKIKKATQYQIKNSNLLLLIFLHEDISKIYDKLAHTQLENYEKMKTIKEDFLTLAFIGDRALELGILSSIWNDGNKSRDIPQNGDLDTQKKCFVENENLSKIWDFLDLYDNKILTRRKNESVNIRASRMEAVFGIIYLESGLEVLELAVTNLKKYYESQTMEG
jgi:ribonuclease III